MSEVPAVNATEVAVAKQIENVLKYIANTPSLEVLGATYGRKFTSNDAYAHEKAQSIHTRFSAWYCDLDDGNRNRLLQAANAKYTPQREVLCDKGDCGASYFIEAGEEDQGCPWCAERDI